MMAGATGDRYDAIVIGSGQSGGPLATAMAGAGWRTALVEREHIGGACINEACTPTKTMVASARVAYLARRSADYGVETGAVTIDMGKVRERKRAIVERFRSGSQKGIEGTKGVEIVWGEARFTDAHTIEVQQGGGTPRRLTGERIFINTGARPAEPPISGLDSVPHLDSTSVMELDTVPEHLLVLGAGYVGLEFGQMFRRFGSAVTMIDPGQRLIEREDPDIAEAALKIFQEDGIEFLLGSKAARVGMGQGGGVELTLETPTGERKITGSHLLVAVGRTANTDMLNLGAAGVKTDERGWIQVNERLETGVPGVYAMGDVKGGPAFTHISYDDYRILKANLLAGGNRTTADRPVPYVVYTDPQLGRVGVTESQARGQGKNIKVAKMKMTHVARALETDEPRGLIKAVVDAESEQILGCAVLGVEGGELMSMMEIAMMGKMPYTALQDGIFAHPAFSESLNNLFGSFEE
jgi:pyruvate/2-oxoglutarate dehydrogenase complex dihydrolipoamide dehydrogenase (E3) component